MLDGDRGEGWSGNRQTRGWRNLIQPLVWDQQDELMQYLLTKEELDRLNKPVAERLLEEQVDKREAVFVHLLIEYLSYPSMKRVLSPVDVENLKAIISKASSDARKSVPPLEVAR